jgi:GNAT superfamily N-acetyltransferase
MRWDIVDVDLENFRLLPAACIVAVFWEVAEVGEVDRDMDPRFEKEQWFSATLLEWGRCGKLVVEKGRTVAFAEYAPAMLFPRLVRYPASAATSSDAVYLSYCFVEEGHRGRGLGRELIRAVARDAAARGYRGVEAIGDRGWDGTWVLPASFLRATGFEVVRDDPRFPLLRLDLDDVSGPARALGRAAVELPAVK